MTEEEILVKHLGLMPILEINGKRITSNIELAMREYAHQETKVLVDRFIQYLDEDIHDGKNLLQSARNEGERIHIAAAISTLYDVKEKFLQLINAKS